jgi:hypothetical protein
MSIVKKLSIDKGVRTKTDVMGLLVETNASDEPVPKFNKGIDVGSGGLKFDGGCIKMTGRTIQACDSGCDECEDVWDVLSAPRPTYGSSPQAAT